MAIPYDATVLFKVAAMSMRTGTELLGRLLGSAFSIGALAWSVLCGTLTVLGFTLIPAEVRWPGRIIIPIIAVLLCLIWLLGHVAWKLIAAGSENLPRVQRSLVQPSDGVCILLLSPSEAFSLGAMVAIYAILDDAEILAGLGEISNVQQNRMVQVRVHRRASGYNDLWNQITANHSPTLRSLRIKPHVPLRALGGTEQAIGALE